jgi:hypothetical protein
MVLTKMKETAEAYLGVSVNDAVVTGDAPNFRFYFLIYTNMKKSRHRVEILSNPTYLSFRFESLSRRSKSVSDILQSPHHLKSHLRHKQRCLLLVICCYAQAYSEFTSQAKFRRLF